MAWQSSEGARDVAGEHNGPSWASSPVRWLQPGWAKPSVEEALLAALGTSEAGGLRAMAAAHLHSGGKRLRARLALCAGECLQLNEEAVRPWALACELLHNATLVHDDLQDGDTTRRGAPTVWVRHGVAQAINVGDWLFMRAFLLVAEAQGVPPPARAPLLTALAQGLQTVIEGQARECSFRGGAIVGRDVYRHMVQQKTAALFVLPMQGLAHVANGAWAAGLAPHEGFAPVGELFQWADDVIDLYGDKGRQARGQDLYEGKMSALVVEHTERRPQDAAWLQPMLTASREATCVRDVHRAYDAFIDSGALRSSLLHIDRLAEQARAQCGERLRPVLEALLQAVMDPLLPVRRLGGAEKNDE